MTDKEVWQPLVDEIAAWHGAGRTPRFWLRDDDAIAPTAALDRLIELTARHAIPVGLAVIPARADASLGARLDSAAHIDVLVHGWRHDNHAGPADKKQELGLHRPAATVLAELASGLATIRRLFHDKALPVLVPPWNRIDKALVGHLRELGFDGLSVFGKPFSATIRIVNSTVDIIDWHGGRGGRDKAALVGEIVAQLHAGLADPLAPPVGILTHHLVHDAAAWSFLEGLFAVTREDHSCAWLSVRDLIAG